MAQPSRQTINWDSWKPRLIALAIGLVAGPLIANWLGWTVTSGAAQTAMQNRVVQSQASICEARARGDVAEPAKLDYTARNDLAKKWALMPGEKTIDSAVMYACAAKLGA